MLRNLLTTTFVLLFIGTMFGSLFHMVTEMSPTASEGGCPFMASGESICSMNAFDHITAWQENFLAVTPLLLLLVSVVGAFVLVSTLPHFFLPKRRLVFFEPSYSFIQRMYNVPQRSLQIFFARGILHPKLH